MRNTKDRNNRTNTYRCSIHYWYCDNLSKEEKKRKVKIPTVHQTSSVKIVRKCRVCNAINPEGDIFCLSCGEKLEKFNVLEISYGDKK